MIDIDSWRKGYIEREGCSSQSEQKKREREKNRKSEIVALKMY